MKHALRHYTTISCLLALSACVDAPPSAYQITNPESLLVSTSDVVTIDLTRTEYSTRLSDALAHNPPTRAILNCAADSTACKNARLMLAKYNIVTESNGEGTNVTLVYVHTDARDCEQRYVDNSQNERNLNYSAFGCSVSGNTVQMVTDKRQFTNPNLLDYRDGEKTATVYDNYLNPPAATSGSSTSGGGSGNSGSLIPSGSGSSGGQ